MATAWYRPGFVPKIVKSWKLGSPLGVTVELWNTTCEKKTKRLTEALQCPMKRIHVVGFTVSLSRQNSNKNDRRLLTTCSRSFSGIVTNFGKARCNTLVVPANPRLSGVNSFPYFPIVRLACNVQN